MPLLTPEERIGSTVGGYRLDRLIGEGGMGVVFEAMHAALETRVAIKLLHPHLTRDESTVTRFEREARAAAKIRHPNVVRILDFVIADDGAACIVMDLLTGESLTDRLKRAPLPAEEAAEVLLPIMDAIEYMHESGIVHRDLKPDNIYLSREGGKIVPKLLDFGIAKVLDDSSHVTRTGMVVGTPAYMSPEQARGSKDIGPDVDIWAMGIVWFECMTGATPFAADGPQAMLAEILTKQPPPLRSVAAHVSEHVAGAIDTALAPKSRRFTKMQAFASALQAAFDVPAPSVPPPSKPQQPMPGSPLSATGPIGTPFPKTRATPQPMEASVATSDTLLADPNDPTQPSGNQLVPQPVPAGSPPRRGGFVVGGVLTALVVVGVGVGVLGANSDDPEPVTRAQAVGERDATVESDAPDADVADAPSDVVIDSLDLDAIDLDAIELDAAELEAEETVMRPSMMRAPMAQMAAIEEPPPELPEVASRISIDATIRARSSIIPRICSLHQRSLPQPFPSVTATFTIGADGRIDRSSVSYPRGTPFALGHCVTNQIIIWRFPQARNPTTLTRSFATQ